jgi:putative serine protease PepD
VGADDATDVALIRIEPSTAPPLTPIPLGDSTKVAVGEAVVAIGSPLGLEFSLSSGVVSATDRDLQSPNGATISGGIQTDAAINPGNSGGPLIDATGHVIGINEQIDSQSGGNEGIGFAVPINTAITVMEQMKAGAASKLLHGDPCMVARAVSRLPASPPALENSLMLAPGASSSSRVRV